MVAVISDSDIFFAQRLTNRKFCGKIYFVNRKKSTMEAIKMYGLMALAEMSPLTGDNFPAKILIIVGIIAVILAVVTTVMSKKKKK